jgi:hypothetical protein
MLAKEINFITVDSFYNIDGIQIAEVSCNSYVEFKKLPHAVELSHFHLGKSGWNSDSSIAYYRTDKLLAKILSS